ncbi:MAG: hypothetical protein JXL85_07700, partial [Bacilli bacterium]|nr:hypothetical protein [Bacilli bacterium]
GVHYLTDVLVGAILGIGIAFLMAKYYPKLKHPERIYRWILIAVLAGLIVLFVLNYIQNLSGSILDTASFYFDTEAVAKMLGTISGFIVAIRYEKKYVQFENHKILYKNLIRFGIGIVIIMAVRLGLKGLFTWIIDPETLADGEAFKAILAGLFDYIRYFAMLFVGIGLYPKLFKIVNL